MFNNKKALTELIAGILFLLIIVVSMVLIFNFYTGKQTNFLTDVEQEQAHGRLEVQSVEYVDDVYSVVGVRNYGNAADVKKVFLNDQPCNVIDSDGSEDLKLLYIDCPVEKGKTYSVDVQSTAGIFQTTKSVLDTQQQILSFIYRIGSTNCQVGESKIFGLDFVNNSHVDLPSFGSFTSSLCAKHININMGNSCSGLYKTLFYIDGTNNSHLWINTSIASTGPLGNHVYNWNPVCISASGNVSQLNVSYGSVSPGMGYYCLGSIVRDDVDGGVIGSCPSYSEKIWVSVK
jgi:hypothetical protein